MLSKFFATATAVVALSAGFSAAEAAVTTYSDAAAFNAATTGATTATFGTGAGSAYVGASPVTGPGYSITANDLYLFNNNPSYTSYYYNWGTGNVLTFKQNGVITINFTAPVTAFSINLSTFNDDNNPATPAGAPSTVYGFDVTVGTGQGSYVVSTKALPTMAFFGATSTTAFTSITLTGGNNFTNFDNLTLATAVGGAVPEPATWAMMIGGFGLVGGAMRRRAGSSKALTA
jgi:hypothetical protein